MSRSPLRRLSARPRPGPGGTVLGPGLGERPGPGGTLAARLTERGRAELWGRRGAGDWQLLQAAELCAGPRARARLLSAAWDGRSVSWCEERPRSEAPGPARAAAPRHCVCSRSLAPGDGPASAPGPVRILLHNSPACRVLAAGEAVYLLPGPGNGPSDCPVPGNRSSNSHSNTYSNGPSNRPGSSNCPSNGPSNCPGSSNCPSNGPSNCPGSSNSPSPGNSPSNSPRSNLAKFILVWCPQEDTLTITSLARGPLCTRRLLAGDSDFRKLVADAVGLLPALPPLDVRAVHPSPAGLLLATANGEVSLVRNDGTVRLLCRLSQGPPAEASLMMELCGTTLACALGRTLHLYDTETGRLMEETALEVRPLALLPCRETGEIQLLAEDGVYALGPDPGHSETTPGIRRDKSKPREMLEQLVLEEACKYYQKRSLSRSRLTVEKLKSDAMFQAPLALCSILQNHLNLSKSGHCNQEIHAKLHSIMSGEIQGYASLEEAKSCIVNASESKVATYVEDITEQEIQRLFHCQLDREALIYLNSIFNTFPKEAWMAVKRALHLHQSREGLLSARATAEMWRVVLSPGLPPDQQGTTNGAVAVFELICRLLYCFHPKWLPRFVELTQQHLAACRNYRGGEGPENTPLYKRALSVIPSVRDGGADDSTETAIELLLCSERPNAIIQAVRILIERRLWQRAVKVTQRFSGQGPLLKKELFAAMLVQVSRHRALDPYLEEIWELCPEETTAADILDIVLRPTTGHQSGPYPSEGGQLTVGLLRPLLAKVLARSEARRGGESAEDLKTLVFPPPTPPRQKKAAVQLEMQTSDLLNSEL
uniref:BLOC-2 complex member HPS6 n=1 Tax=Pristiophorus japonicus TaxID=55135 RepID=UPI00398EDDF9